MSLIEGDQGVSLIEGDQGGGGGVGVTYREGLEGEGVT